MQFYQEKGLAACGLACPVCREAACPGCHQRGCAQADGCGILRCVQEKGIRGCEACEDFPCNEAMFEKPRVRAFVRYAARHGVDALLQRLGEQQAAGIRYHREDGLTGDYDGFQTEAAVLAVLENGPTPSVYEACPVLETDHFTLRPVRMEDAEDLLSCYSDPAAQALFNADRCIGSFRFHTIEAMREYIGFWLIDQQKHSYIRFAVVDRATEKAVGTVEMFGGDWGVLRVDIASAYEAEHYLQELFLLAVSSFHALFDTPLMVTKVPPIAQARLAVVSSLGFTPWVVEGFAHYFAHAEN